MATGPSSDTTRRVSDELLAVITALVHDPKRERVPTLDDVRADVQQTGLRWSSNGELLYPQDRTSLLIEIDELITHYGGKASAADLLTGSDGLSRQ